LIGVLRNGTEYSCQNDIGFTDGPSGSAEFAPMVSNDGGALPKDWPLNSVAIGLNEDCWLGINGMPAAYSGQKYIDFIESEVAAAEAEHLHPIVFPFREDPGTDVPNGNDGPGYGQEPIGDNSHLPLLWEEIANTFKSDPYVIFRTLEEPWPDNNSTGLAAWECWSKGDVQYGTDSDSVLPSGWQSNPDGQIAPTATGSSTNCPGLTDDAGHAYQAVGMQSLVNIIRGTGATNIVQLPGVSFANMLSCSSTESPTTCGFLDTADGIKVNDPLATSDPSLGAQLGADVDNYPDNGAYCENVACYNETYGPVAAVMPLDAGETGVISATATSVFPQEIAFIDWLDSENQSYAAAAWDTWSDLISSYNGTPSTAWGQWYYNHITGG
jgi:hypothetical protein